MTMPGHQATLIFRDGLTRSFQVQPGEKLLDAALRCGVQLPLDCREGVCATCRGRCESGSITMEYIDEDALSEAEQQQGDMLACQTELSSPCTFFFDVESSRCNISQQCYSGQVSDINIEGDRVATLAIVPDAGQPELHYLPGQYARIQVPGSEQSRAFSWASAPDPAAPMRFLIRLLPQGAMSDYLRQRCRPGDRISFTAPFGAFYLREVTRPLLLIAGGTGLSPLLSMLESLADGGCSQPVRLWYCVSKVADISSRVQLEELTQRLADFRYEVVVSRPDDGWQGKRGRITAVLEAGALQQPFDAYLCGPPAMVEATCDWLNTHPVAEHQVWFERFKAS